MTTSATTDIPITWSSAAPPPSSAAARTKHSDYPSWPHPLSIEESFLLVSNIARSDRDETRGTGYARGASRR